MYVYFIKIYLDKNNEEIISFYSQFVKRHKLKTKERSSQESIKVTFANTVFIDKDLSFLPKYEKLIQNKFDIHLRQINFDDAVTSAHVSSNFTLRIARP